MVRNSSHACCRCGHDGVRAHGVREGSGRVDDGAASRAGLGSPGERTADVGVRPPAAVNDHQLARCALGHAALEPARIRLDHPVVGGIEQDDVLHLVVEIAPFEERGQRNVPGAVGDDGDVGEIVECARPPEVGREGVVQELFDQ
jgi:hypothetical protein